MAKRKVNRSELIREALGNGITKPLDIVAAIQQEHGVTVTTVLISKVKSDRNKTKKRKKPGPKPKAAADSSLTPKAVASSNGTAGTLTLQDITTVKGLLTRLGRDGVAELIAALA